MTINKLKTLFVNAGACKLYAKPLAENDNSKNQVYFGSDFQTLNILPNDGIVTDDSSGQPIFKARLRFGWLGLNGSVAEAPSAQLILYPQYPEVRFSGFLRGCGEAPSQLMAGRLSGRILFLGVTPDRHIIGFVVGNESKIAAEFRSLGLVPQEGVFVDLGIESKLSGHDSRSMLLSELGRIHRLGWIESKQLSEDGTLGPCNAPQCGGFTLEAELGIPKNSRAEPDYHGWEVKQHGVTNFEKMEVGTITLMTPEPTGGFYKEHGPEAFVRRFGYADKLGRADRLNFGGTHRVEQRHATTGLTLKLTGYDAAKEKIIDSNGALVLINGRGVIAAAWDFSGLLAHWTNKHSKAVYVPSKCRKEQPRQYYYGNHVRLAMRTDYLRFLKAMAEGVVFYDPGIKIEHASGKPKTKQRSQFRIASRNIPALYEKVEVVEV